MRAPRMKVSVLYIDALSFAKKGSRHADAWGADACLLLGGGRNNHGPGVNRMAAYPDHARRLDQREDSESTQGRLA